MIPHSPLWRRSKSEVTKLKGRERDIQKAILDFLTLKGIFHYKNSTVGIYKHSTGTYIPSASVGAPDIVAVIGGRYIGIEIKRPGGKMNARQVSFKDNIELAGGIYWMFNSLDEAVDTIEDYKP